MWTRFILTHPYFPQTVYRFRHIFHRAHAILGILKLRVRRGRSFIELQYNVLDCFGDDIASFIASCVLA